MIQTGGLNSSATVHEAAGQAGALSDLLKPAYAGAHISGPVYPVSCPQGDNLHLHHAIYRATPGEVLLVAIARESDLEFGYWGEVMAEAAKARGLAGLVIDGGVRDTIELARVGFPVFSSAISIRGTGKDPRKTGSLGAPITISGVQVERGDHVVADADGVVVIPAVAKDEVSKAVQQRVTKEDQIITRLREGMTSIDLLGLPNLVREED